MARWFIALFAALMLAGCGGGGSSSSSSAVSTTPAATATTPTPTATVNVATVTLDAGPSGLQAGNAAFNTPFVSVTLCAPGSTTNCQTIDHVILDTGSVGLRIIQPVLSASLLSALPTETDSSNNPVGECYQYVNSYVFGSVRTADFSIAGEKVSAMPFQAIADTGSFTTVPSSCSAGGGVDIATVNAFGANGILGVGATTTDCGVYCTTDGGASAAIYYDCPSTGCSAIVGRASNAAAPFQQLPNPVAAFPTDNNGVILSLPSVAEAGVPSLTGTVTFGIGTQTNNGLTAANVLPVTTSSSRLGPGVLTVSYTAGSASEQLTESFLDSGSNDYFFIDASLNPCTATDLIALYCPTSPLPLSPVMTATNGVTASGAFTLYSPLNVANASNVAPGLGINPTLVTPPLPFADTFDFGLPFFLGRTIYTSIEGRPAGGVEGPYFAF